jgi:multidrug resistance efflux pump
MRGKWILFAGITILLAVAAGALSVYRHNLVVKPPPPSKETTQTLAPPVTDVSLTGLVQAQRVVNVPTPVEGIVESFSAEIGQDVFEGQLIAHIRNTKLESAVEGATLELERLQARVHELEAGIVTGRLEFSRAGADASRARSEFDRADKAYQRQRMLIKEGATPRLVFEKAELEYNTAKDDLDTKQKLAQHGEERVDALNRDLDAAKRALEEREQTLERAKAEVGAGDVRAPVDGIVISRRGQAGDQVNRTMDDLFRIAVAISALEIAVQPEPAVVPRIKVGQPAAIHLAEAPNEIAGTVREIKDGRVIIDFISPTTAIKPGLSAQVRIKLS